jgi:hypothetical protein
VVEAHVAGGIAVEEVTRNARTGEWHPHLHLISDVDVSEAAVLQGKKTQIWESGSGIEETAQQSVIRQADQQYRLSLKLEEITSQQGILSDQGIVRDGLTT